MKFLGKKDNRMTFDSPFIVDNKLYLRYSMVQILSLDLSSGKVEEITESRSTTSKIFNSNGYLGFPYIKAVDPLDSGEIEFNIIEGY